MERNYKRKILKKLRELRLKRDKLIKQIEDLKNTIWGYTYLLSMPDDDDCLKAQKELDLSKLQLKNLVEQINALEKNISSTTIQSI
jgi:hypothetical protein